MPANEKLAPRAIVELVNARHGTAFTMLSRAPAGESGAYFVSEPSGKRFVLKFGSGIEFQPELGAELTSRLRALGYPAPVYVVVGCHEGVSYAIQELMPGAPQQTLTASHVRQLIALNRLQAGLGHGLPLGWPSRAVDGVLKGYSEYCVIETLARHSAATTALLALLQEIVDRHSRDSFVTNDIVHWDFNGGNILADETRITGVVDWDGACAGDRGFDLATLMFYSYEVRHIREPLWREALDCSGVAALSIYIAHMIVRQVDWSIRYHPAETVNRYLEISGSTPWGSSNRVKLVGAWLHRRGPVSRRTKLAGNNDSLSLARDQCSPSRIPVHPLNPIFSVPVCAQPDCGILEDLRFAEPSVFSSRSSISLSPVTRNSAFALSAAPTTTRS